MNCKEAIDLAEEAMDKDLPRAVKRRLDLHLSRCESCRRLFDAERAEHVRWFRIFNDPAVLRRLPPGFADRLAASARLSKPFTFIEYSTAIRPAGTLRCSTNRYSIFCLTSSSGVRSTMRLRKGSKT